MESVATEKKRIRIGEKLEAAIWVTGEETPEQLKHHEEQVQANFDEMVGMFGIIVGPINWYHLMPGEERTPPVPNHISGWDVKLLVGEASILGYIREESGFVNELDDRDRVRLRQITRRKYAIANPGQQLTDEECDAYINELGPTAALTTLRRTMH